MSDITGNEGQVLYIDYSVGNTGGTIDRQDITLEKDGTEVDRDTDTLLDVGEATTGLLRWRTEIGDAGTYTVSVNSDDDTDSITVEVQAPDRLVIDSNEVYTVSDGSTETYSGTDVEGTLQVEGTLELTG